MPREKDLTNPGKDYKESLDEINEDVKQQGTEHDPGRQRARQLGEEITEYTNALGIESFADPVVENVQGGEVVENPGEAVATEDKVIKDLHDKLAALSMKFAEQETPRKQYNLARFLAMFSVISSIGAVATLIYNGLRNAQLDKPMPPEIPPDTAARIRALVKQWNNETDPYYWQSLADYTELSAKHGTPLTLADQLLFMDYTIGLFPGGQPFLWNSGDDLVGFVDQLVAVYRKAGNSTPAMYRHVPDLRYRDQPLPRAVAAGLLRYALTQILVLLDPVVFVQGKEGDEGELSRPKDEDAQREESEEEAEATRQRDEFAKENKENAKAIDNVVSRLTIDSANCQAVDAARTTMPEVTSSAISSPEPDSRLDELREAGRVAAGRTADASEPAKNNNTRRYLARFIGLTAVGSAAAVIMEYLIRQARRQPSGDLPPIPEDTKQKLHALVDGWNAQPDATYWNNFADYVDTPTAELTAADQILFCNYTIQLSQAGGFFLWDSAADKAGTADLLVKAYEDRSKTSDMYRAAAKLTYHDKPLPRADTADLLRLALTWIFRTAFTPDPLRAASLENAEHLRPRVHVAAVAGGGDRAGYARELLARLYPGLPPRAAAALENLTLAEGTPHRLLDSAKVMAALPAPVRARLGDQYALLLAKLNRTFAILGKERLERSAITALAEPAGDLPAGTLCLVRETSAATVHYLLPHIVVDAATGTPRLTGLPAPATPRPSQLPKVRLFGNAANIALQVSGTLVWALPEPWGPLAAGGVTLIQLLFGQSDDGSPFTGVVTQLEDFIKQQDITHHATVVKAFVNWMVEQQEVLKTVQGDDSKYINESLLPELRKMTAPGDDSVYDAVYDLENYLHVPGAFDLMVLAVSVYLLGLKMIVQLDAMLASPAYKSGDQSTYNQYTQLWLGDYANFHTAVMGGDGNPGWVQRVGRHIADFQTAHLAEITGVYRYDNREFVSGTSMSFVKDSWGWTYRDTALGEDDLAHFMVDTFVTSGCCASDSTRVEHRTEVQAAHDQHVAAVTQLLDAQYGKHVATVKAWQTAIDQWNEHLPPQRPTQAPTISPDGWRYTTPRGAYWVDSNQVSYAVAFANHGGPSPTGPWSDPVIIKGKAGPTLTGLPDDPLGMAVSRQIWRRFDLSNGTKKIEIVGLTTGMDEHTFKDDSTT
ncbi:hypothetical protein SAMN05444920_103600 [Nonomuraea solani]|uniref:Uncharacterized protein n=1 Tax=Nonomuraea solani TaxID=1144553 RepID=A0A1H6BS05_9ACTN|nr:hypothetical protein [Nonomuraea solani]SEG63484.1 hypothetical protein SAMN05444920_103600 [Nonomuraea solani]